MSNELKRSLLNLIQTLTNNNIELEKKLFLLSSKKEEQDTYYNLLEEQKEMLNAIKELNRQEENLIILEEQIQKKEKYLNDREKKFKEKEKNIKEKEKKLKEKDFEDENKKILEKQNEIKNLVKYSLQNPNKVEPKKLFENISKLGKVLKNEMEEELKQNPDKFVDVKKDLNSSDSEFFPSAVLANYLQKEGILTVVEKNAKVSPLHDLSIKLILNGLIYQKKIIISYDFGTAENHLIIYNVDYQKDFIEKEYDKISKLLDIPKEYINICNFETEFVQYELLINDIFGKNNPNLEPFITTNLNYDNLINKLNSLSTSANCKINIKLSPLIEAIKLSTDLFDSLGDKDSGWSQGQIRGG